MRSRILQMIIEPTPFFLRADSSFSSSSSTAEICRSGVVVVSASDGSSDFREGRNIGDLHGMTAFICSEDRIHGSWIYGQIILMGSKMLTYTDFPAYSDTLRTWEKCHCKQVSL